MVTLQDASARSAAVFGSADRPRRWIAIGLLAAVACMKMAPGLSHPKEKEAYAMGRAVYFHRAGAWISLRKLPRRGRAAHPHQDLPCCKSGACTPRRFDVAGVSRLHSQLVTLQWRMNNCFSRCACPT